MTCFAGTEIYDNLRRQTIKRRSKPTDIKQFMTQQNIKGVSDVFITPQKKLHLWNSYNISKMFFHTVRGFAVLCDGTMATNFANVLNSLRPSNANMRQ